MKEGPAHHRHLAALIACFMPTVFHPRHHWPAYQQFAVTVGVSVMISTFNSLSLSPALAALLLRPRVRGTGPVQKFYDASTVCLAAPTRLCKLVLYFDRKSLISMVFLGCWLSPPGFWARASPWAFYGRRPGISLRRYPASQCGFAATHR